MWIKLCVFELGKQQATVLRTNQPDAMGGDAWVEKQGPLVGWESVSENFIILCAVGIGTH